MCCFLMISTPVFAEEHTLQYKLKSALNLHLQLYSSFVLSASPQISTQHCCECLGRRKHCPSSWRFAGRA